MKQKMFKLTWQTYTNHLKDMMEDMMKSDDFTDVTLITHNKKAIKAHRSILSANSPVFKNIFQMETNSNHPIIYLRGIKLSDLQSILEFIYLEEASVQEENIDEFFSLAKNLEIKELVENNRGLEPIESFKQESPYEEIDIENDNLEDVKNQDVEGTTESNQSTDKKENARFLCDCDQCDYQGSRRSLKNHILSKHGGVTYPCSQCDYQATREALLTRHFQHKHVGSKYSCSQCDYEATWPGNLQNHIKNIHDHTVYSCDLCEYKTTNKHSFQRHKKYNSHNESPTNEVICSLCDYRATHPTHLTRHYLHKHEGVRYPCSQCDYQATWPGSLQKHIQNIHDDKTVYSCDLCDYTGINKESFQRHTRNKH